MRFDLADVAPADRYKLLASTITPRPIAWVTTVNDEGRPNAAPYSFFNVLGEDPPVVGFSVADRGPGSKKDTEINVRRSGEFVVNLVSMPTLERMNVTAIDFPPEVDELEAAGLRPVPAAHVAPPLIAESPVSLECRLFRIVGLGALRSLIIGEVLAVHIVDRAVLDPARFYVDNAALDVVGRMHTNSYTDTRSSFLMPRLDLPADFSAGAPAARRDGKP